MTIGIQKYLMIRHCYSTSHFSLFEINNKNYQLISTYRLMFKLLLPLGQTRTRLKLISNSSKQMYRTLLPTENIHLCTPRAFICSPRQHPPKCGKTCDKIMPLKQTKSNLKSLFPIGKYFSYWSVNSCNVVDGPMGCH